MTVPKEILFVKKFGYGIIENPLPQGGVTIVKDGHMLATYARNQALFVKNPLYDTPLIQLKDMAVLKAEFRKRDINHDYSDSIVKKHKSELDDMVIKSYLQITLDNW